ncbi:MAG: ATP-dependent helicase, partial [Lachnospiraceae bacterium]|nr:ATP-dependent helicase [Lachnospiraceae bacterium]
QEGIPLLNIYKEYNAYLKANCLMDYDDQMIYAYNLLKVSPELLHYYKDTYKYICVDEAQDTSKVQHVIIKLLAGENGNLFMVGDEDQSIYGFRAAYPEALLNFEKDHPAAKVLVMDQNYRSNAKIVAAADKFIQHNKDRHEKHMVSTRSAESDIHYIDLKTRSNQYSYVVKVATDCNRETAVLYRDNENALPVIDQLDRQKIPYRIKSVDMAFFTHRIVTDVTNIMRFAIDPYNTDLFMRIYFKCQTYLKKNQAEQLCRISTDRNIPVLEAAQYASGINGMVMGKCKALATHLRGMLKETPSKALFRIETPLGYGDYLERNNIDANKLYILKQLAYNEHSILSFLARLEYLQNMLKSSARYQDCRFILSTIHSSKGLEYDQVYLMDVCDGVFPGNVVVSSHATPQERKAFEEERRLFYVGMTRAKNDLHIFKISSESSSFIREINSTVPEKESKTVISQKAAVKKSVPYSASQKTILKSDFDLVIGELVVQIKYGPGVVDDVEYDSEGNIQRFTVEFDSGEEKAFIFPIAFKMGMKLESGEKVDVREEAVAAKTLASAPKAIKKSVPTKKTGNKNTYAYWAATYPDYVVVKREGAFWTCRGESAETISELLGYRLGGNHDKPVTGSPNLEPITGGLRDNAVSYIVVEDGMIIEQREF